MEYGETFSEAWVPHLLPMLRNFLAPTLYRHTILLPSVSASPLLVQIADEGSMPKRLSTPPIVFSVPLFAVALFCAKATVAFVAISTAAKATAAMLPFTLAKESRSSLLFQFDSEGGSLAHFAALHPDFTVVIFLYYALGER